MNSYGLKVKFDSTGFFNVIFERPSAVGKGGQKDGAENVEKTREKMLALIKNNPTITADELAEKVGISIKGVEWQLKKLREEGTLKRIGPDKGGSWEVLG